MTIALSNGRIHEIAAEGIPSSGGTVIDGTGKALIPALIIAHAHQGIDRAIGKRAERIPRVRSDRSPCNESQPHD